MSTLRVLGIMSGTSLDGIDYAICRIGASELELESLWSAPFSATLRKALLLAVAGELKSWELARLHHDLGRLYASGAAKGVGRRGVDLCGLHGQTIFHEPHPRRPATLQIGEPVYLAEKMKAPVVNNFRVADMAAGGQGAPLATAFHRRVFARKGRHVCINNLGGISNVTSLDWRRPGSKRGPVVMAFDTGPANLLIDRAVVAATKGRQRMDRGGRMASHGRVDERWLKAALRHRFFRQPPPKSTGREMFGETFWKRADAALRSNGASPEDCVATLTEFTVRSLGLNYRLHLKSMPDTVVLTGGGAANPVLVAAIRRELGPEVEVQSGDALGWPVQSIEPAAFAWLAWLRWKGLAGNLPETTGASRAVLCGQWTDPP